MEPYIRKGDGLLLVCQNNVDRTISIREVNDILCDITGFGEAELMYEPVIKLLGHKAKEAVEDYVEYDDFGRDMHAVLSRIQDFRLRKKNGEEVAVSCKIVRSNAYDRHHWFRLIIKDEVERRAEDVQRNTLVEQFRTQETLDADIRIPDRQSLENYLLTVSNSVRTGMLDAVYVMVRLDDYAELITQSADIAHQSMRHVAATTARCLRTDDVIGRVEYNSLGLILNDITMESARVVLNRLRWAIASDRMTMDDAPSRALSVSLAYAKISGDASKNYPEKCKKALEDIYTPNAMIEL